jgi:glucose-6-phosphate dehydrogenase assembly protein OpcA
MTTHLTNLDDLVSILEAVRESRRGATNGSTSALASTMNLIVYIDDADNREWVIVRAERFVAKHPARLIVLDASLTEAGVDVSTLARQSDESLIVSERIDVTVGGVSPDMLPHIARELSSHDLPTALWWTSKTLNNPAFDALIGDIVSLVVDSSGNASDRTMMCQLGDVIAAHPHLIVHDLAFMRLDPWRDLIAQFFDDPALREDLFSLRHVEIDAGSRAEALYMAGWLASSLSWTVDDGRGFIDRTGKLVVVETRAKGDRRRVLRVALRSDDSEYTAAIDDADERLVSLSVSGSKQREPHHAPLQAVDNTALIERAVIATVRDQAFETALAAADHLIV